MGTERDAGDHPSDVPETPTVQEALDAADAPLDEEPPPPAGTVANLVVAVLVTGLGVATVVSSLALGIGSAREPGAGTWPFALGLVVVVFGLALVAGARRTADAERFPREALGVVAGIGTMVAFTALIGRIGFEIPGALLCFVWLRWLGGEGWRTSVLVSLGIVAAFYAVFVGALGVGVPHLF
ncbi:tripartite tricarboxylate transporter TctB family protein [uncultured Pseudokineococcus sp.]|uniref:tripartite tricarboxylate transporter TctB family protein n=1 Tax=uncultured Pseudokineococcus sp. TaxID=1642928 RepID=UPI002629C9AE|nr:tripartite tricarboxylate transporter TctB family protein [uncultured Pseudokineococcus sp.]